MIKIIITRIPKWSYYQWFLLGMYMLKKQKRIKLFFRVDIFTQVSLWFNSEIIGKIASIIHNHFYKDSYTLEGYCLKNGKKKYFCIDCSDSPYMFDSKLLEKVSIYFKMQCPIKFEEKGFPLTEKIYIPYSDISHVSNKVKHLTERGERKRCTNLFDNIWKIKPAMVGPRQLSTSNSYKALKKSYDNYLKSSMLYKTKKLMCYFGSSKGPKPSKSIEKPDYDWESDLLAFFKKNINHPNEKRAIAAQVIEKMGKDYDSRIINFGNSDTNDKIKREILVIPLSKFCDHIAQFEYNLNISGYRMSIPNRFIESFMAGTAIITDKLHVKWYKKFDNEVFESVEMGYLPMNEVNWKQFEKDIKNLPVINRKDVLNSFHKKWSPLAFANYIIDSLEKAYY